jgi:hypothetical protein
MTSLALSTASLKKSGTPSLENFGPWRSLYRAPEASSAYSKRRFATSKSIVSACPPESTMHSTISDGSTEISPPGLRGSTRSYPQSQPSLAVTMPPATGPAVSGSQRHPPYRARLSTGNLLDHQMAPKSRPPRLSLHPLSGAPSSLPTLLPTWSPSRTLEEPSPTLISNSQGVFSTTKPVFSASTSANARSSPALITHQPSSGSEEDQPRPRRLLPTSFASKQSIIATTGIYRCMTSSPVSRTSWPMTRPPSSPPIQP